MLVFQQVCCKLKLMFILFEIMKTFLKALVECADSLAYVFLFTI